MSKILKVGIVGLGRAGRGMQYNELMENQDKFAIVAGCDNAPDRQQDLPEGFADAKLYTDYDEMLKDPNIDLIAIATRHRLHAPMAIKAVEAGKYVSVDKPCAINLAEMDRLIAAAEKNPGKVYLRHNRRFEAPFQKALELMKSGLLGDINMVKLYRSVGYCRRNDWMTVTDEAGGLLTNWGPHIIDQMLQFLESNVIDCWASIKSIISIGDGDDNSKIILKAENGRIGDIEISGATTLSGREIEIQGSKGTLVYPVEGKIQLRYLNPAIKLEKLQPHLENPPFAYGNFEETLRFIDESVEIPPRRGSEIWVHIYDNIVNNVPYPITFQEARMVVYWTDQAFHRAGFKPAEKFVNYRYPENAKYPPYA